MNIKWIRKISWGNAIFIGCFYTILTWISQFVLRQQMTVMSLIAASVTGVSITIMYYYLRDYLPKGFWKRSTFFADIMVSTSFIFFTVPAYFLLNMPGVVLVYWFISTFVVFLITSMLIVKLIS